MSCAAIFFVREQMVVTGELTVRYARPCPIDVPLDVSARITRITSRYFVVDGAIRQDGVELARSQGKFFPKVRPEPAS
jgi:acyl-coenzyme A thioesterase PaaI-like protein